MAYGAQTRAVVALLKADTTLTYKEIALRLQINIDRIYSIAYRHKLTAKYRASVPCFLNGKPVRTYVKSQELTVMENKVLEVFLENGASCVELAAHFNATESTIKQHFHRIFNKTGYSSRAELAVNMLHKKYQKEPDQWPTTTQTCQEKKLEMARASMACES